MADYFEVLHLFEDNANAGKAAETAYRLSCVDVFCKQ
jgi:hypothetical protein